jgi:hypothetical protein
MMWKVEVPLFEFFFKGGGGEEGRGFRAVSGVRINCTFLYNCSSNALQ